MGRRSSSKTRIAECFIQLVVESSDPSKRVSTTDIVNRLGMDRKSFYRYFDNTSDLVVWIFRSELAETLAGSAFEGFTLEYPDPSLFDAYPDLAFFARGPLVEGRFDQSEFTKALAAMLNGKSEYYQRILTYPCYLDFYYYLLSLFKPAIRSSIVQMIGPDLMMPEGEIDFLTEYHTVAYIGRLQYWYVMQHKSLPEGGLDRMWNYSHEALRDTIDRLARPQGTLED